MSFSRTERRKLRNREVWFLQKIANKIPLLGPRKKEPGSKAQGSEPCKLALPASHHHLDVLPLFIFLLRRRIRLRRHDCPLRRPGHGLGRRGAWSGSAAGADLGALHPCRVLACLRKPLSTRNRDWPRRLPRTSPSLGMTNLVSARNPGN